VGEADDEEAEDERSRRSDHRRQPQVLIIDEIGYIPTASRRS
jgi:DNA replication protein DnaC